MDPDLKNIWLSSTRARAFLALVQGCSESQEKIETDKKKQMRNNKQVLSDEEKDEIIKQALEEQHHLETFKNLYRLRHGLCEHYRTLLNEKVQKQRIQIKMSNFRVQQRIKHKEKKYIPSHKVPFCKLSHDTKYLETIPQSSSYLIIGLQNELAKLGMLRNQEDYENFWNFAQKGVLESKLKEMLPEIKAKMFAVKHSPLSTSTRTNAVKHHNGFASINRLKKSTTPSLLQSGASSQFPTHHMSKQMTTQTETKEMFSESKTFKRNRRAEQHLHYLHHMYYFSLVNMASSKRLLEKNGQFSDVRTKQTVYDLHEQSGMNRNIKTMEENTCPSLVGRKQQEMYSKGFSKMFRGSKEKKRMSKQHKNKDVGERAEDQKCNITTFTQQEVMPVPLTLEDAALYHPIMEVKHAVTCWENYADNDYLQQ
ncbi:uncharacterized protein LOC125439029 isoform X2 [Sphaerodactylus townsendi]|uniref:uncharacterized protein LOC125439029 isoform X2 n=1 Tax=Sphaerodactylus townsendi TaxID=933632 RepID=UPI0020260D68|nr:uncharacterized protein LOC125439029 isoform X2 [Sphaerodactylus townsendi]